MFVQHAHLLLILGQTERALERYEQAAAAVDPDAEPILHLAAVTGSINCLCDLDRPAEAERLLATHRQALLDGGDGHLAALHSLYQARIDLGLRRLRRAEAGFTAARDRFLAVDRDYDAIIASLYLADALLAAAKTSRAGRLATELVPLFRSRGVERETLASLRLLADAAKAEALTAAVIAEVREKIQPGRRTRPAPSEP